MERLVASELRKTGQGALGGPSISQLKVMPFALMRMVRPRLYSTRASGPACARRRRKVARKSPRRTSLVRTAISPERVGMRHGDDIVAAIDKMNLAGDARREGREQVESGAAKLFERHAAMQRRMALLEGEHETRIGDAGSRQRADGPRRNRIDANAAGAEIDRHIPPPGLDRRLCGPHGIVVRHR